MDRVRVHRLVKRALLVPVCAACMAGVHAGIQYMRQAAKHMNASIDLGQAILLRDNRRAVDALRRLPNPNAADGEDSILEAMRTGDSSMVALLVRYGASPSLSLASARSTSDCAALIRLGASANGRLGPRGETPLMRQCIGANARVVRYLLMHGGDPLVRDFEGRTALDLSQYASEHGPLGAVAYRQIMEDLRVHSAVAERASARRQPGTAATRARSPQ